MGSEKTKIIIQNRSLQLESENEFKTLPLSIYTLGHVGLLIFAHQLISPEQIVCRSLPAKF